MERRSIMNDTASLYGCERNAQQLRDPGNILVDCLVEEYEVALSGEGGEPVASGSSCTLRGWKRLEPAGVSYALPVGRQAAASSVTSTP
eukprot:10962778-Heterocapsa_arctica.AAC.1